MAKVLFNNKIEDNVKKMFDNLHKNLGGHKFRIIESSIELFNAMPEVLQRALISYNEEERQLILDIISQLKSPPEPKKSRKKP